MNINCIIDKHFTSSNATGGGGLALFGTGNLHTWASSIDQVYKKFTDNRKIDRGKLMDDSAYRLLEFRSEFIT